MIYQLDEQYYVRTFRKSDLEGPYLGWFEDGKSVVLVLMVNCFPANCIS